MIFSVTQGCSMIFFELNRNHMQHSGSFVGLSPSLDLVFKHFNQQTQKAPVVYLIGCGNTIDGIHHALSCPTLSAGRSPRS